MLALLRGRVVVGFEVAHALAAPLDVLVVNRIGADAVVCLSRPADFGAVGLWYSDFTPVSDQEVRDLLNRARFEREAGFVPAQKG